MELHDDIIRITKFFSGSFRSRVNTPLMPSFERLVNSSSSNSYTVFFVNITRLSSFVRHWELNPIYPIKINKNPQTTKLSKNYYSLH